MATAPQSLAGRSVIFDFLNAAPADAVQSPAPVDTSAKPAHLQPGAKVGGINHQFDFFECKVFIFLFF